MAAIDSTIEPDTTDSDLSVDSGVDEDSLGSSLREYFEQNGRRYHVYFGQDRNPMPNDELEQERLDVTHEATLIICRGQLHLAPVDTARENLQVLDLGTGTGIWAIDFAYRNPKAQVLGTDLSPIQPNWIPSNLRFVVDDFERDWSFGKFDFIHARCITQSVMDWPRLLRQALEHLNPGGWFEASEYMFAAKCDDGTMPADWPPKLLFELIAQAMRQSGRMAPTDTIDIRGLMEEAGFVDIRVKTRKLPSGVWAKKQQLKEAGALSLESIRTGYQAYGQALLTRVLGMDEFEVEDLCDTARKAHFNRRVHSYWEFYSVCGRKP